MVLLGIGSQTERILRQEHESTHFDTQTTKIKDPLTEAHAIRTPKQFHEVKGNRRGYDFEHEDK